MRIAFLAAMLGVGSFLVFHWSLCRMGIEEARTMVFCSISFFEWLVAFNCRADETTIFKLGIFRNRPLMLSIFIAVILQAAVLYVPVLRIPFNTVPLGISGWAILATPAIAIFVIESMRKIFFPRLFGLGKWSPRSFGRGV